MKKKKKEEKENKWKIQGRKENEEMNARQGVKQVAYNFT